MSRKKITALCVSLGLRLGFYFWGYNNLYFSQQDGVLNIAVEIDLKNPNPNLFGTRCESYTSPNFSTSFSLFRVDIVTKAHIVSVHR